MSPESGRPNRNAETIHTPESRQECVLLEEAIDTQMALWAKEAQSNHPAIVTQGLASIIINDTTPGAAEKHQADAFRFGPRSDEAHDKIAAARRLELIIPLTQDEAIDEAEPLHIPYIDFFNQLDAFKDNPETPASYGDALDRLYRLFLHREQVALATGETAYKLDDFVTVLRRLVEDIR